METSWHNFVVTLEEPAELVDVVNEDDVVLRTVSRPEMRRNRLRHRAVFILVTNSDGKVLIHRRSEAKDIWPGWWDVAVGGVVAVGEDYESAAARELAEEVGVVGATLEFLGSGAFDDRDVSLVAQCFLCRSDGPFEFADGEVTATEWVSPDGLLAWLGTHRVLPDSVALVLPRIVGERSGHTGLGLPT